MSLTQFVRHTQYSQARLNDLLKRLDESASTADPKELPGAERRVHPRWRYRHYNLRVHVEHPRGGSSKLLVGGRNLSAGGLSFIHTAALHAGSRCRIVLTRTDRRLQSVTGEIVSCRHVEGSLHEIAVRFVHTIDPHDFSSDPEPQLVGSCESITMAALQGQVMYINDSVFDQEILNHQLEDSGLAVIPAADEADALATFTRHQPDLILCDSKLASACPVSVIESLRMANCGRPIALVGEALDGLTIARAREAGCTVALAKPVHPRLLLALLGSSRDRASALADNEPSLLYSDLDSGDGDITDRLAAFIEHACLGAQRLELAASENRPGDVGSLVSALARAAEQHGFTELAATARSGAAVLDGSAPLAAAVMALRHLAHACQRLSLRAVGGQRRAA